MKITYLDQVPVRYNYSTPSMSRRGGTKLHPIKDGTALMGESQYRVRTRDFTGQPLREIIHPQTGYVHRVTSAIESAPVNPVGCETMKSGVSGAVSGQLKLLASEIRFDSSGNKVYLDEDGRRIRTVDMGEGFLGAVPRKPVSDGDTGTVKRGGNVSARAPKRPASGRGTAAANPRITEDMVDSYIRALAGKKGQTVKTITPSMRRDAKLVLVGLHKQMLAKTNGKKGGK